MLAELIDCRLVCFCNDTVYECEIGGLVALRSHVYVVDVLWSVQRSVGAQQQSVEWQETGAQLTEQQCALTRQLLQTGGVLSRTVRLAAVHSQVAYLSVDHHVEARRHVRTELGVAATE